MLAIHSEPNAEPAKWFSIPVLHSLIMDGKITWIRQNSEMIIARGCAGHASRTASQADVRPPAPQ